MTHLKFLLSAIAFSSVFLIAVRDLGWSQTSLHDPDRLQSQVPLQDQDPEKEMYWKKEQLLEQLKETEMKQEGLQEQIHSQNRSDSPILPKSGIGGDMGQVGDQK